MAKTFIMNFYLSAVLLNFLFIKEPWKSSMVSTKILKQKKCSKY